MQSESLICRIHNLVLHSFKKVWVFAMYRKGYIVFLLKGALLLYQIPKNGKSFFSRYAYAKSSFYFCE